MTIPTFLFTLAQAVTEAPGGSPAGTPPAMPAPSAVGAILPFILIAIIFYFLIIRPQQKRMKEHQTLVASVKTGDEIVTNSGIHGIVTNVKDATLMVKVADNVKIEFDKSAVAKVEKAAN